MQIVEAYITKNDCWAQNVKRADKRYATFQDRGPTDLMLHSVGCARDSGALQVSKWDKPGLSVNAHAAIDANTGTVYQALPWNYRGWHSGSGPNGCANDTHVGVEMCESRFIKYTGGANFEVLDRTKAVEDCVRVYSAAVELFAYLCETYAIDPLNHIISHREGGKKGIASGHVDPEHYWNGLGMNYSMDTFRAAVKAKLETEDTIYRIQVGAFRNKAYAEAYLKKVQEYYPNAFLVKATKE